MSKENTKRKERFDEGMEIKGKRTRKYQDKETRGKGDKRKYW